MKEIDIRVYKTIHCSLTKPDLKVWLPNEWSHDLEWATGDSLR